MIDETHDPNLESWVDSANLPGCDFPIQNLPLGMFRTRDDPRPRVGTAIGNSVFDVSAWIPGNTLNGYMTLPREQRRQMRALFSRLLAKGSPARPLRLQSECEMLMPAQIGDYTDFYASIHHATNVGKLFRPDNPLLPNYEHVPIAYHGRASTVVVSETPVRRPNGQLGLGVFGPSKELDYEVELGAFIGPGNAIGEPIGVAEAATHIAGVCLLNDWSARDIQRWEYQPLGPFLAKNFATSISSWLITWDALSPFRVEPARHDVPELEYLQSGTQDALEVTLEVSLRTTEMDAPIRISSSSFRDMYWTLTQMIAHHTSNGCALRTGDLIGSGTVSGPHKKNGGCLLELTSKGAEPLELQAGVSRCFLEDGDEVIISGYCERPGFRRIGLGACSGTILAARAGSLASPKASI